MTTCNENSTLHVHNIPMLCICIYTWKCTKRHYCVYTVLGPGARNEISNIPKFCTACLLTTVMVIIIAIGGNLCSSSGRMLY